MVTIRVAMAQELRGSDLKKRKQLVFAVIHYAGYSATSDVVCNRTGEVWWMVELSIDADVVDITQHPTIEVYVFCADSWGARESLLGSSQVRMPRYGLAFHELTPLLQNQVTTGQLLVFVDATAHWSAADVDLEHWSALTLAPKEDLEQPSSEATPHAAELSPRYASEGTTVEEPEPEHENGIDETSLSDTKVSESRRALTMPQDNESHEGCEPSIDA
ncbi:hypothetical protein SPRG_15123 [Saprolegnia parasitica CBS 223.65]|uniref:C2 domain-containing protein n=1 Tax=Saprolegnia parasitica (strain CBS 223.65) TaxID=695850 RepID=A0A067BLB7_SAPPC|nr:hypothetical protein SPRG_15123 [Saprolegnia parasitica CBS 223.65]KDO19249.1 hypothetical protein SPRG_15123 [Saprolegnia parasitica CBS 223.65]|eukprot:XP_012210054.1 hypothetical protein SPRG_15123 [Saprolegnia parasitica CBS 223.65]